MLYCCASSAEEAWDKTLMLEAEDTTTAPAPPTPAPVPPTPAPAPKVDPSCASHPGCAGLAGDCCPNMAGAMLYCCASSAEEAWDKTLMLEKVGVPLSTRRRSF